ncbi:MAG: glycoside hydrolase family 38 C-terminal domain-containing protein [bacterium]
MDVIIYAHTHWDREWYRPFEEFRLRLIDVIEQITAQLLNGEINCFYLDGQTIILEDYLQIHPQKKQTIIDLIKDKKLMIGPWYVLADEFLVSGESLIRNLLIGINQAKDFGYDGEFIGYLPDSFGHNSEIPRILASFNIKNAVVWRGVGNHKSEFIWKSKDNSSVLATYLIEGYFQDILNQNYSIGEKTRKIAEFLNKIREYTAHETILLPVGGDHLGPAPNLNKQIDKINKHIKNYTLYSGCITDYINTIANKNSELEEITGELRDNSRNPVLPGTLSARLYLKQYNARLSWKLNKLAEPLQTHIEHHGMLPDRKKEFEYAWKLLLKNHPHDSICGCSIDEVHNEMEDRFNRLDQILEGLISRSLYALDQRVEKGSIIIYNSSDYSFNGVLKVKTSENLPKNLMSQYISSNKEFPSEILFDTQRVPLQEDIKDHHDYLIWVEDIPPHSINIIDKDYQYKKYPTIVETNKTFIKNSRIIVRVNIDGTLTLTDSDSGKEFYGLHVFYDYADKGDTYNFSPIPNDKAQKARFIKSEVIENNQLRGILRLFYEMEMPESLDKNEEARSIVFLTQIIIADIIVYADSRRVEFETSWENTSKDHILQLRFKHEEKIYKTVSENTFGLIERDFDPDYNLAEHIPASKGQELKTNTAPMQRFVWANGLGIITEGLSEYGVIGNDIYITLLRSVGKLSRGAIDTRGIPAGPPLDVPEAQCLKIQKVRYALCATNKPEALFMEADQFMKPLITSIGMAQDNSREHKIPHNLLVFDNSSIYTYAVKSPENKNTKGIIIRLMNISSEKQSINIKTEHNFSKITEVNSLEKPVSEEIEINQEVKFNPFELKTFLLSHP